MGWSYGYDTSWDRDVGYGVPAACDHPGCSESIDRGLSYVCGGEPMGGEHGCGLYFCSTHLWYSPLDEEVGLIQRCQRCCDEEPPFDPSPDVQEWVKWKLTDESWAAWRSENPAYVAFFTPAPPQKETSD